MNMEIKKPHPTSRHICPSRWGCFYFLFCFGLFLSDLFFLAHRRGKEKHVITPWRRPPQKVNSVCARVCVWVKTCYRATSPSSTLLYSPLENDIIVARTTLLLAQGCSPVHTHTHTHTRNNGASLSVKGLCSELYWFKTPSSLQSGVP